MPSKKRRKNVGVLWEQPKKSMNIALTDDGKSLLRQKANELGLSVSEMVELVARGTLNQPSSETSGDKWFAIIGKLRS